MLLLNTKTGEVIYFVELDGKPNEPIIVNLDYKQDTAPLNPQEKQIWYNTSDNKIYTYKNGAWDNGVEPSVGVFYKFGDDYYLWDGNSLEVTDLNIYEKIANKTDNYNETSSIKYPSSTALHDGLDSVKPQEITNSGNTLPTSTTGYQQGNTFLNTTDKKLYTITNDYALASNITEVKYEDIGVFNNQTGNCNGFTTLSYNANRYIYDTSATAFNNINIIPIQTNNDITTSQTIFCVIPSSGYPDDYLRIYIENGKLKWYCRSYNNPNATTPASEYNGDFCDITANSLYVIKVKAGNVGISSVFIFEADILDSHGNILAHMDVKTGYRTCSSPRFIFGITATASYSSPFKGTIFKNINDFVFTSNGSEVVVAGSNIIWDSGVTLTNSKLYLDKTNQILYFYYNGNLTEIKNTVSQLHIFDNTVGSTLNTQLELSNTVLVFKNGQQIYAGADRDYTINGSIITFTEPLVNTDVIGVINSNLVALQLSAVATSGDYNDLINKPVMSFSQAGLTETSNSFELLAQEIQSKNLPTGTILYGEVSSSITPMPFSGNAEVRVEILETKTTAPYIGKQVLEFTLYSADVAPYQWTFVYYEPLFTAWEWHGIGGGSSTATINYFDNITGTTLDTQLTLGNAVYVFKNGVLLQPTADYTISGSIITFVRALINTDKVAVINGNLEAIDMTPYQYTFTDGLTTQYKEWVNKNLTADSDSGYIITASNSHQDSIMWHTFNSDWKDAADQGCWYSGVVSTPYWLQLEIPEPIIITECTIKNEVASPANFKNGIIQGSIDGINFDNLYTITDRPDTTAYEETYSFSNTNSYKYLRLLITEDYGSGTSIQFIQYKGHNDGNKTVVSVDNTIQRKAQIIEDNRAQVTSLAIQANKVYKLTNANITDISFASCEQSELVTKIDFTTGSSNVTFSDGGVIDWADGETPHFYSYQHYWIIISDKTGFVKEIY